MKKASDVTRSTVQKSVCVLSRLVSLILIGDHCKLEDFYLKIHVIYSENLSNPTLLSVKHIEKLSKGHKN